MAHAPLKTGRRFGRWTVVRMLAKDARGNARVLCQCKCGERRPVLAHHLRSGRSAGCGMGCPARPEHNEPDDAGPDLEVGLQPAPTLKQIAALAKIERDNRLRLMAGSDQAQYRPRPAHPAAPGYLSGLPPVGSLRTPRGDRS